MILLILDLLAPLISLSFAPHTVVQPFQHDALYAVPALVLFFALGAVVVRCRRAAPASDLRMYSAAFALRAVVAVALGYGYQYDDEAVLHYAAEAGYGSGYARLLHLLYAAFGVNLFVGKALNVAIGALLVVVVGDLVSDSIARRRAQQFALVAPPLVLYGAVNLKETTTAFVIVCAVSALVRGLQGRKWPLTAAGAGTVALGALWWLRGAHWAGLAGLAVAVGFGLEHVLRWGQAKNRGRSYGLVAAFAVAVVLVAPILSTEVMDEYVRDRVGPAASTSYYINRAYAQNAGVTSYLAEGEPLSPRVIATLWARGLFVPSPLRVVVDPSAAGVVEFANSIGWYAALFLGVAGFLGARRVDGSWLMLGAAGVVSLATTSLVALGADPTRHRVVLVPLLCALAGMFLSKRRKMGISGVVILGTLGAGAIVYNVLWLMFIGAVT